VTSIIKDPSQENDIKELSAKPLVLSLADAPVADFTKAFQGADVVYFSAGAGGKGGAEMTKKVDYEGAVKVFDALEGVEGKKPLLIMVSAIDVRDPEKVPAHYVRPYHTKYLHEQFLIHGARTRKTSPFPIACGKP
jgi:hypothetical protein